MRLYNGTRFMYPEFAKWMHAEMLALGEPTMETGQLSHLRGIAKDDGIELAIPPASVSKPKKKKPAAPDVPPEYICPITMEIMTDPVSCSDGHTYERKAIAQWFTQNVTSPKTGLPLPNKNLVPNHSLRALIRDFVAKRNAERNMG